MRFKIKIGVIGLGYVGLPLALEFGKYFTTIGYDNDFSRVNLLKKGKDKNKEFSKKKIFSSKKLFLTNNKKLLSDLDFYIITVPTPVSKNKKPDLRILKKATALVSNYLNPNKKSIIVYESTVYPGCTREICVPLVEKKSNLIANKDFFYGYSPERINPGSTKHTIANIKKIISGSNKKTLDRIYFVYKKIIKAGIYKCKSIEVAEGAKVIENTQRDVNIALVNELCQLFNKLGINFKQVLSAASTKWNFLNFYPGLVGGHCVGVDPYYLAFKAKEKKFDPKMILSGRKTNEDYSNFLVKLVKKNLKKRKNKILISGTTFKPNCSDVRNSKVIDIYNSLKKNNTIHIIDEVANKKDFKNYYGFKIYDKEKLKKNFYDCFICAVDHDKMKNFNHNYKSKFMKKKFFNLNINEL